MQLRTVITPCFLWIVILGSISTGAHAATLNLMDFGAVGDGVTNDGPALQNALNALANAGGGTLIVPEGRYAITTPVSVDFTGRATSITILGVESDTPVDTTGTGNELSRGLDLVSEFIPKTGAVENAISISGLQTFLMKDISFMGTPNINSDAHIVLLINNVEDATVRHCEFYGLSTQLSGGAIVAAVRSGLKIEQTKFLGSTGNSGVYVPVVEALEWTNISVTDSIFLDYGLRPELFSKTGVAAPYSWINIGNAKAVTNDSPRREATVRQVFLDEGGFVGISSIARRYQPPTAPIDLIYISNLRMNVSNLQTTGHYLTEVQSVFIENSRYEWSHNADSAFQLLSIYKHAIVDRAECLAHANRIRADAGTQRLSVINSTYTFLDSLAQTTTVLTTTPEEDPVQYVRQRFETVLGRAPDPAAHYYWSDLLLLCGTNAQCVSDVRADLNAYLGSGPSLTFTIQGQVKDQNGNPISGVTMTLGGSQAVTTQTDSVGGYTFSKLPTSGAYTLAASKRHYTFPSIAPVETPSGNKVVNVSGTLNRHTLRGRVTTVSGKAVQNVTITVTGAQSGTATTDANGDWSVPNLPAGGTFTMQPTKSTYGFTPVNYTTQDLSEDRTFNFNLNTYYIGGTIARLNADRVSGVTLSLSGSETAQTTTNSVGNYIFPEVPAGGTYVVTPTPSALVFTPASQSVTNHSADRVVNFTAANANYTVSGNITSGGLPLPGVSVALSGSGVGTTTTDANGAYSFSVAAEGSYTLTPAKKHYTFTPATQTIESISSNRTANFAGMLTRHTISGRVSDVNNTSIAGVTINLSGNQTATTTTDGGGNFSFPNLPAGGTYNVTPNLPNHSFSPQSKSFTDLDTDQSVGFVIQLQQHTISGRVVKQDGTGLATVTVGLSGGQNGSTVTDPNGNYSFANLPAGRAYVVTPSKPTYGFNPGSIAFDTLNANQTANFTGLPNHYRISGRITVTGFAMPAVSVALSGSQTTSSLTDSHGDFSFTVPAGGSYVVTPSNTRYAFTPPNSTTNDLAGDVVTNFTATIRPGFPLLISEPTTTRGLALDSVLRVTEPFELSYEYPWSSDRRTRLILYVTNFELQPGETITAVTAEAEDASHRIYPLTVEYFGKLEETEWFNRVVVRLHDDMGNVGDVLVRITYRGVSSNRVRVGIGHIGGGLPDDVGSFPTPGHPPQ